MHRFVSTVLFAVMCCLASVARAAGDPFAVGSIQVDASAASAVEAQTIAINQGRSRAWTTLFRRLVKEQDWPHQPVLDDTTLQRLVRSYTVGNERRSTTRFVASMTYIFNADAVRRLLRQNNIAYVDMEAHPILIVPMAPGYLPHGGWTATWANPRFAVGAVPLVPPVGDSVDAQALSVLNFGTATWQDVEPVASRVHAQEAYLALALVGKGEFTVKLKRLGPGTLPPVPDVVAPIPPRTPPAKASDIAAGAAANAIVDQWKMRSAVDFNKRARLIADVRFDTLGDWSAMLQKLSTIPTVTDVGVVAMDIGEARVAIGYVGTADQLTQLLSQADLALTSANGGWVLAAVTPPPDAAGQ